MFLTLLLGAAILVTPSPADRALIFESAGFTSATGEYLMCDEETPLGLVVRDFNGDGRLDAIVTDGGSSCYGNAGNGFTLLTHTSMRKWTRLFSSEGTPTFLKSRANGWPDLEIGGPGECFQVLRWNGKTFADHRHHYEGKPCKP